MPPRPKPAWGSRGKPTVRIQGARDLTPRPKAAGQVAGISRGHKNPMQSDFLPHLLPFNSISLKILSKISVSYFKSQQTTTPNQGKQHLIPLYFH